MLQKKRRVPDRLPPGTSAEIMPYRPDTCWSGLRIRHPRGVALRFTYTSPPITQGATTVVQVGAAVGLGALPGAADWWARLVETTPEVVLIVVVPWVGHVALFWALSLAFGYVDRHDRPEFIARHRIQSGDRHRPERGKVARNLLWNQGLWSPVMLLLMWGVLQLRGWAPSSELPTVARFLAELAGMGVLSVLWFYVSHRLLHRPWWMKRVHRVHHEFRRTEAVASEYAHWFEFTTANFGTLACGVLVLAPSLPAIYVYTLLALTTVLVHHSGYALPWASWSVHHDWHHFRFKECFGTLGVMDKLLGTDEEFRTFEDGETR